MHRHAARIDQRDFMLAKRVIGQRLSQRHKSLLVIDTRGDVHHRPFAIDKFIVDRNELIGSDIINHVSFGQRIVIAGCARHDQLQRRRADADDVARLKRGGVNQFTVQFRAVGAVQIANLKTIVELLDHAMRPARPRIGNDQRVGGVPSDGGARLIERKFHPRAARMYLKIRPSHAIAF